MKSYILKDPGMRFNLIVSLSSQLYDCFVFSSREIFVKNLETDELYGEGDMIKRVKFARTLEIIAQNNSVDAFYNGELADLIVEEIQNHSGIITKQDLANYTVDFHEAIAVEFNQSLTAFITPPPTSGIILAFIMNILKGKKLETKTKNLVVNRL